MSVSVDGAKSVTSGDGTTIGYLTTGRGPPVIVIPGVLSTAESYAAFAAALGENYTVHIIERRGRGSSGPQGADYGIAKECEDALAVQEATGAACVFGHSYGGLIALELALRSPATRKVAVYEPGVSVDGSIPLGWMPAYEQRLAAGKPLDAFAVFSVGTGPGRARRLPVWLMARLLPRFIARRKLQQIFDLLPANLVEHRVVGALDNSYRRYGGISADVLFMSGERSDLDYVPKAATALAGAISSMATLAFPKLDHFGPDESGPAEVARAVSTFFAGGKPG